MKDAKKGQVSLEYMIVTSLVLISFVMMGIVVYEKYSEWADLKTHLTIRKIATSLAENINEIVIVGDGYSQEFVILQKYTGDSFNVTFRREEPIVLVEAREITTYAPLLTTEVYCCLDECDNVGDYTILHINSTLDSKIINYDNKIYIGKVCP